MDRPRDATETELVLPPADDPRRGALLEEWIGRDIERCWQRGERVPIDRYAERFPELGPARDLPPALILLEYRARRQAGDRPGLSEFKQRFPLQFLVLQQLISEDRVSHVEPPTEPGLRTSEGSPEGPVSAPPAQALPRQPAPPRRPFSLIEKGLADEAARPKTRDTTVIRVVCGTLVGLIAGIFLWSFILHLDAGALRVFLQSRLYWIYFAIVITFCASCGALYGASGKPRRRLTGAALFAPVGWLVGNALAVRLDWGHALLVLKYNPYGMNLEDFPTGIVVGVLAGLAVGAVVGRLSRALGPTLSRVFMAGLFGALGMMLIRGYWVNEGIGFVDPDSRVLIWTEQYLVLKLVYALGGFVIGGFLGGLYGQVGRQPKGAIPSGVKT
jgi:hypothetical protein